MRDQQSNDPFLIAFRGSFTAALRWPQFDALWEQLRQRADVGWFLYALGEPPPDSPATRSQVEHFLDEIETLFGPERKRSQCGLVYADDPSDPSFIKIYDPDGFGGCGIGVGTPLPGWTMSLLQPCELSAAGPLAGNRRRWWRNLLGRS